MPDPAQPYDVIIIGQGAAAYGAALYSARYQMKTLVIGDEFGGETATGSTIENYPGYSHIDGFDLMLKMKEQVQALEVEIVDDRVNELAQDKDCFILKAYDGEYRSTAVILAVGRERRKLGLPLEQDLMGKGVSYCSTCDAPLYKDQSVAVVGGGDAAVKGSVLLAKYAREVYLIYRKAKLTRPEPINLSLLEKSPNVVQLLDTNVKGLVGNGKLERLELDKPYMDQSDLRVDGIFIEIGADPRNQLATKLGAMTNDKGEIMVSKLMETTITGLFAAGDVTDASGELKQTITSTAQGVIAATSAYKYVSENPNACQGHAVGYSLD
ncbi:MAG: FAD-dependent oxidoreductase [Chloroflexi bacterium]|nr:FAD-dependent oxidoreductase [Chloroflexota bacterium]